MEVDPEELGAALVELVAPEAAVETMIQLDKFMLVEPELLVKETLAVELSDIPAVHQVEAAEQVLLEGIAQEVVEEQVE